MRIIRTAFSIALLFTLVGCFEKNTDDPIKAYQYWTGEKPDKEIQVINGKYWESVPWSKEYIMYLELKACSLWREEFIKQNNLKADRAFTLPDDIPTWFTPKPSYKYGGRYTLTKGLFTLKIL